MKRYTLGFLTILLGFFVCFFRPVVVSLSPERLNHITNALHKAALTITDKDITNVIAKWKSELTLEEAEEMEELDLAEPSMLRQWAARYAKEDAGPYLRTLVSLVPVRHRAGVIRTMETVPPPQLIVENGSKGQLAEVLFGKKAVSLNPTLLRFSYSSFRRTMSHELIHYYVQGDRRESVFRGGTQMGMTPRLSEGFTEFLALKVCDLLGWDKEGPKGYSLSTAAVGALCVFGSEPDMWDWFRTSDFELSWENTSPKLASTLLSVGLSTEETQQFLSLWEKCMGIEISVMLTEIQIKADAAQWHREQETLTADMQCGLKAGKTFRELEELLPNMSYEGALASGLLQGMLDGMAVEYSGIGFGSVGGYPQYLSSTVVPRLRLAAKFFTGTRVSDPEVGKRLDEVGKRLEGKELFTAIVDETIVILAETLTELAKKSEHFAVRFVELKAKASSNRERLLSLARVNDPLLRKIVASPELQRRVREAAVPEEVKVQLLAAPEK